MSQTASDFPPSWAWTTLGAVATVLPGFGFPERLQGRRDGDFPFLKVRDISRTVLEGDTYARTADNYVTTRDCAELRARPLPAGTIVFAKIGEAIRLNRRAILAQDSLVDNNAMGALAAPGLETLFLFYYLTTLKLGDVSRATTVPSVRKSDVESLQFPLAPLHEQRRIVAKIEELFSQLDVGVEELKKAKAQLKRYRQSVLKAAFEGKLTEEWRKRNLTTKTPRHKEGKKPETAQELLNRIREERKKALGSKYKDPPPLDTSELPELPEGWAWSSLGQLSSIETGNRDVNEGNPNGEYAFFTCAREIHRSDTFSFDCEAILVAGNGDFNAKYFVGKFELYQRTYAIHSFRVNGKYMFHAVDRFLSDITKGHRGSTISYIRIGDLTGYCLPVPPFAEQAIVVEEVERRLSVVDAEEKAIEAALKQAARLRQSILKRAFEGRLVPQDPSDEPATELLRRIREERLAMSEKRLVRRGKRLATRRKKGATSD